MKQIIMLLAIMFLSTGAFAAADENYCKDVSNLAEIVMGWHQYNSMSEERAIGIMIAAEINFKDYLDANTDLIEMAKGIYMVKIGVNEKEKQAYLQAAKETIYEHCMQFVIE